MTSREPKTAVASHEDRGQQSYSGLLAIISMTLLFLFALNSSSAAGTDDSGKRLVLSNSIQDNSGPSADVQSAQPILIAQVSLPAGPPSVSIQGRATGVGSSIEGNLIDILTRMPPPSYVSPARSNSSGWSRGFGAVRSGTITARIEAAAPRDHTGLSLSAAPKLWWLLGAQSEHAIQITIVDENAIDPVFRTTLKGPHPSGLNVIDLSQHGVELKPGADYRWFVTLVVDPDRPSRNPLSEGSIRVLADSDFRRAEVAEASPSTRGHRLAQLGVWYDAYDFFSDLAADHPEAVAIARHRDRLTETLSPR